MNVPTPGKRLAGNRVLITGGLGFIGSNLARGCVAEGAEEVVLLSRTRGGFANIRDIEHEVRVVTGSVTDEALLADLVPGADVIYHLAAQTSHIHSLHRPLDNLLCNCGGTLALLESVRIHAPCARVFLASTVTSTGHRDKNGSGGPEAPLNFYDAHKLLTEKYAGIYASYHGVYAAVIRLANVFGEWQRTDNSERGVLNYMLGRAIRQEPLTIYGKGDVLRDYSYVRNIVDAFILAANSALKPGVPYSVGSGTAISFSRMVEAVNDAVFQIFGRRSEVVHLPFPEGLEKIDVGDVEVDPRDFQDATGWRPTVSFEDGLLQTAYFLKSPRENRAFETRA